MKVSDLWAGADREWRNKTVDQMVSAAGTGKLGDGNATSAEFRSLLGVVDFATLHRYALECLTNKFVAGGLILQDIINAIGERLGFSVKPGRYQGTSEAIGFDGVWRSPDGHHIVVEIKTTDAYRIKLDTAATYREKLVDAGEIPEARSSILYVVGRYDTGDLEAQIRGSRYAWTMRLISVDALIKLMNLSTSLESPRDRQKIFQVLQPYEYTRLDSIIDLVFTAKEASDLTSAEPGKDDDHAVDDQRLPADFHQACVDKISKHLALTLIQKTKAQYSSVDGSTHLVVVVSKTYQAAGYVHYWFAFHPYYETFLGAAKNAYIALGCGSPTNILLIPLGTITKFLPKLTKTTLGDRFYYHVKITNKAGGLMLRTRKGTGEEDLDSFRIA